MREIFHLDGKPLGKAALGAWSWQWPLEKKGGQGVEISAEQQVREE